MNSSSSLKEFNVKEALVQKEYEEVAKHFKKSRFELLAAWSEGNKSIIKKYVDFIENMIRRISYLTKNLDKFGHMIYEMGCLAGAATSIRHVLYCVLKEEESVQTHRNKLQYINHLSEIVKVIDKEGPLSHTDLSEKLKMNVSTLSEAMKKILAEDVITSSVSGKYKVYSLTDRGRHYAKYLKTITYSDSLSDDNSSKKVEYNIDDLKSKIGSMVPNHSNAIFPGDNVHLHTINGKERSDKYATIRLIMQNEEKEYANKTVVIEEKDTFEAYDDNTCVG